MTAQELINDVLSQAIDEYGDGDVLELPPRKEVPGLPPTDGKVIIAGSPEAGYRIVRISA
jgi:hypothetical protein